MEYILVYTRGFSCYAKQFKQMEAIEEFLTSHLISKHQIIYLGEYKPLKYKITIGVD